MSIPIQRMLSDATFPPLRRLRASISPLLYIPPRINAAARIRHHQQCRSFYLYKTAISKVVLGMHKVLPFSLYTFDNHKEPKHRVNLVQPHTLRRMPIPGCYGDIIAEGISFEELYETHVKPGWLLYLADDMPKRDARPDTLKKNNGADIYKTYGLYKASAEASAKARQAQGAKHIHLGIFSDSSYYTLSLNRAYHFLEAGCRVEFILRLPTGFVKKKITAHSLEPGDPTIWPWLHNHFPHLRPDFICRAMPAGTYYLIDPVSDGRTVQFVLAKPTNAHTGETKPCLTPRLFEKRKAVIQALKRGEFLQNIPSELREKVRLSEVPEDGEYDDENWVREVIKNT
ncbi:hypothetical protein F5Y06DRAFT_48508 [Hypoxylon sp. FL0890]|nr:hypothetical protein F5Y06DRAFT_48508 [Hypoxylon sp. FL0890]